MPEARPGLRRLAEPGEGFGDGGAAPAVAAGRQADGAREETNAIGRREEPVAEERGGALQRPGDGRRRDRTRPEHRIGECHVQAPLHADLPRRADLPQEVERLGVRPHEGMRAVVDDVARHRVGEGVGTAPEEGPPLEEGHARAGTRESHRRRQAREAASDDRDVRAARVHPASR